MDATLTVEQSAWNASRQLWPHAANRDPRWPVRPVEKRRGPLSLEKKGAQQHALYRGYGALSRIAISSTTPSFSPVSEERTNEREREREETVRVLRYRGIDGFASTVAPLAPRETITVWKNAASATRDSRR